MRPINLPSSLKTIENPSLYQINVRTRLTSLSRELHRAATLDDLADDELDRHRGGRVRARLPAGRLEDGRGRSGRIP